MVDRIYPTELQLNKANSSDTEAPFLNLNPCISNGALSTKFYAKGDDFFIYIYSISLFRMAMSACVPHIGYAYLSLLDSPELLQILVTLTAVIKPLLPKLLRQGYRYFKLRKAFSKFYRRHSALVAK